MRQSGCRRAAGIIAIFSTVSSNLPPSQRGPEFVTHIYIYIFIHWHTGVRQQDTTAGLEYSVYWFIHGDSRAQFRVDLNGHKLMPDKDFSIKSILASKHIEVIVTMIKHINCLFFHT